MKTYLIIKGLMRPTALDDGVACFWRDDSVSLSVPEQLADGLDKTKYVIEIKI